MGSISGLFVDPAAVQAVAATFEGTAASVAETAGLRLAFGSAGAGRGYAADGAMLRDALDVLVADLRAWARSAAEVAAELRFSAERYVESEHAVVAGLG